MEENARSADGFRTLGPTQLYVLGASEGAIKEAWGAYSVAQTPLTQGQLRRFMDK